MIGHGLPESKEAWKGSTQATAGTLSATDFWIPKGEPFPFCRRFTFCAWWHHASGNRGACTQTVKQLRGEKAGQRTKRKVEVISTKSTLKMVNNIQKFDLMQTEAVSELVMPVTSIHCHL